MDYNEWLDTFVEEKGIDPEEFFEIEAPGALHIFHYGVVIEAIKAASRNERDRIRDAIVKIDLLNGDVRHYFRHLASALV